MKSYATERSTTNLAMHGSGGTQGGVVDRVSGGPTPRPLRESLGFAVAVARFAGWRGLTTSALVGLGAILEGAGILLLVPLLATLFDQDSGSAASPQLRWLADLVPGADPVARLAIVLAAFGLLMTVRMLVLLQRDTMLGRLQIGFIEAQRMAIARRLAGARWQALAGIGHARVTHLMGGDIQRCGGGVHFLLQSSVAVVLIVVQAGLAFVLAPVLTALALVALALGAVLLSGLLRKSHDVGSVVTQANLAFIGGLGRFLGGMKMAMSQNLQQAFVAAFEDDIALSSRRQAEFQRQQALLRGFWSLLAAGIAGVAILLGYGWFDLPGVTLFAWLVLLARISGPAGQIHLGLQQIAYTLPAWHSVQAMERELATAASPPAAGKLPAMDGPIVLDQVVYRHDGTNCGVDGLSLHIEEGEVIGLTGASGAGKTTLADLLIGLVFPQSGQITIGGEVLTEANAARWRERVAYVAQDPVMFNDSLRHNLLWAAPDAEEARLVCALAAAGADRWVSSLPDGLEIVVGEGGSLISGGERQRLAIARALLREPSLLILDEATNAIDIAGERELLLRLKSLDPRPIVLIIAHRGETLAWCDRVLTLSGGRLDRELLAAAV